MPDLSLKDLIQNWGYSVSEGDTTSASPELIAEITGKILEPLKPVVRANAKICNIGAVLGVFDAIPQRNRYSVLLSLLELNWEHPMAHIGIVDAPMPADLKTARDEGQTIRIIVAETTFFWIEGNREFFDTRMFALNAVALAASQVLSSRGALSNTNPFYDRLKGTASPVARDPIALSRP